MSLGGRLRLKEELVTILDSIHTIAFDEASS